MPERANARILGLIFEYLQWVGMKQTNSVLLSESPVTVDLSIYGSRVEGSDYLPDLCKLLEVQAEEDKGTPTRSQNYSRDEFEDSKLSSASGNSTHQSVKSKSNKNPEMAEDEEGEEIVDEASDFESQSQFDENLSVPAQEKQTSNQESVPVDNIQEEENSALITKPALEHSEPEREEDDEINATDLSPLTSTPKKFPAIQGEGDGVNISGDNLINFSSPIATFKGFGGARASTTRQRSDSPPPPDPFQSPGKPTTSVGANFQIPVVTSHDRLDFVDFANVTAGRNSTTSSEKSQTSQSSAKSKSKSLSSKKSASSKKQGSLKEASIKDRSQSHMSFKASHSEQRQLQPPQQESLKDVSQGSAEEESTSDFMETLTMEDDTQDVSIASDSKGMSSCEHVISFK